MSAQAETTTPRRPRATHQQVATAAADNLLEEVTLWLVSADGGKSLHASADIRADLIRSFADDGYVFAKNLDERCGWVPDTQLVKILDGAGGVYTDVQCMLNASWVLSNGIVVPYAVDDIVTFRDQKMRVVEIMPDVAKIIAQPIVADGHNYGATGGYLINYEDVTP